MLQVTDRIINEEIVEKSARRFREKKIILPTFQQQRHPELIPDQVKEELKHIGLWDLHPLNLFRITWKKR